MQNQVGWPQYRGVPHVTPRIDIITCILRTWDLRVPNVFQVSVYPPAMFIEGTCKAQQAEMMILSQYLFLENAQKKKKRKNASNVSMVHTLLN